MRVMKSCSVRETRGRRMQHPDEGMIHTWLDGELPAEETAALEAHVGECEECAAAVAEARGFVAASSRIVSALDAVPRGAIPIPKPASRPWYAKAQFRAAAALLLVAGTSLVVVRGNRQSNTAFMADKAVAVDAAERTDAPSALAPPNPESAQPQTQSAHSGQSGSVVQSAPSASAPVGKTLKATDEIARSRQRADVSKSDETLKNAERMEEVAAKPADLLVPKPEARRKPFGSTNPQLSEIVVTGVATAASESDAALRVVSTDSAGSTKRTVIEVSPGVQVTFTEADASGFATASAEANAAKTMASAQRAAGSVPHAPLPAPPSIIPGIAADLAKKPEVHTITWVDSATGRTYSLSGPLSVEKLEALKPRLVKLKR